MKRSFHIIALVIFSLFVSVSVQAGEAPKLVKTHGAWKVYSFKDKDDRICFMSSQPRKMEGKYKKRGEVFFFVTRWSSEKDKNVVSISNGYTFKNDSQVSVKTNGDTFKLFTQGEMAWTKDQTTDNLLTKAIQKGSSLVVKGVSKYGTETTDTYSLTGSADAFRSVKKACKQ